MSVILSVILAIVAVVLLVKFVKYKKFSEAKFDNYEDRLGGAVSKGQEAELRYKNEISLVNLASQNNEQTISALRDDIENLHKEKEEELKLRLKAEKQMELALQKVEEMENKIEDWEAIHDANLQDTQEVITQATDDLYEKLSSLFIEKISAISVSTPIQDIKTDNSVEAIFKSVGLTAGINYFMNSSIPEEVKKSVPCEAFIISGAENCAIVDNQSIKFFRELEIDKIRNEPEAYEAFRKKIDRYLAYLTNPKYRSNAVNYFAMNKFISPKASATLVMLVPSENDVNEFRKLGENYSQILQKNQITLYSVNRIIDLVKAPL